ncbi:polysaccharide deacetylase family protein [Oceaniglobus roseus]|uniref:polysaccharide deacetylase family protein n=1 Tax=Oceaniglobus roseus TaxID=1737570 RepID=UPI000C7F6BD7|nr:polysaccharide deacetylase family protein [Kandeliimicrobium roseum]
MTQDHGLSDLAAALDAAAAEGRPLTFWLRDDDAVDPTPALDRLIGLTEAHGIPCLLAVIPERTGPALAARLDAAPTMSVALHGWAHESHAPAGEKKRELGDDRPLADTLGELEEGRDRLSELHGTRALPIVVPPWNRIGPQVEARLAALGFSALSVFGPERPGPIRRINTHADLIDWRGTRGGRSDAAMTADILAAAEAGVGCVGLLTHHLVHDDAAWDFLERFLALTAAHPGCAWRSAGALLSGGQAG